jgi:beta-phosphoglucomutase family hydrolase
MAEIGAVIWDMDGVIADSGPYHLAAWQEIFGRRGVKFTAGDFKHSFGLRNDNIIRNTLGKGITQKEVDVIAGEKEETFRRLARGRIKPLPGALELLRSLKKEGFRMAIASSTPAENIELVTGTLDIAGCFQVIVNGHDVTRGKPDPQVFLLAAQRLGVKPENCLVIEDAVAGVTAAKRAGMYCLAVTNTHSRQKLKEADLIVDTLEKVTIKDIENLGHSK